jgi:hypothetical protein
MKKKGNRFFPSGNVPINPGSLVLAFADLFVFILFAKRRLERWLLRFLVLGVFVHLGNRTFRAMLVAGDWTVAGSAPAPAAPSSAWSFAFFRLTFSRDRFFVCGF